MRKIFLLIFTISLFSVGYTQSLDEVLQKHFAAVGQEKLSKVNTYILRGKISQMGQTLPIKITLMRPSMMRFEAVFQGMSLIQAYDGKSAWGINPFMGDAEPQIVPEDQTKSLAMQADIDGALFNFAEKGYTGELLPNEQVEGTDCFVVPLKKSDNDQFKIYIDTESKMILKQTSKSTMGGNPMEMDIFPSNYKEVEGIMFAFGTEVKSEGQMIYSATFESFELNATVDPAIFAFPK
jgi:outer membrane lipoprotein-sorting protein